MGASPNPAAVLITGASTGIGRAAALQLDRLGFQVFASVRKEHDADELCAQASDKLTAILLDVTDPATLAQAREQISRAVGETGLWGLVNNAGISFRAPLEFVPLDELRRLFEVNVFGVMAVTQAFLPLLRLARGRIVNVSSITSLMVTPFHGSYSASKLCVNGLSNALRLELKAFGVQVSLMLYGGVQTALWDKTGTLTDQLAQQYPPQFAALYAQNQQKALNYFLRRGRHGLLPDVAARPIVHALTARRAKNTYFVGTDARFYSVLDRLLYGRLRDWVIMRTVGLTG